MKHTIFTGAATALITPFKNGVIDYDAYGKILEAQIEGGISALVVAGTTGESSTLTDEEHREIIRYAVEKVAGRVPIIAGTGSNDTSYAIELSKFACSVGADALLLVTPYYNKATQNGLYEHFKAIAESCDKPCILYNVPSRTGCNILPDTAARLADIDNIVAIKEASSDISQIAELAAKCGDTLDIYSGNDNQILPIMSLGGKGVISVLSNVLPAETSEICSKFLSGDIAGALELQLKYLPFINALFSEVNPIPAKAAMARLGRCENTLRLPLTPMSEAKAEHMYKIMEELGLTK
ncbi:MAG TPA: 4-hydroxy-tetrahydrodipicolinate synthase [Candidatus Faeciplasma pullistercoris]|uniref:4-hydroxy-tetrahydrodipicolinate synthase n=1 Tax=Candidatus Faeciplasma pullistercoris TaxID=2840800 RepID=A0A9D1KKX9_9FIRM|nr:4-hydroxy-tetrahydrodipicolinate synthase [Candidatus Faeciplasma pullistercoris]